MVNRVGSTELADEMLSRQRATRQRLAGSIKTALLTLERVPKPPNSRIAQFEHEKKVLQEALMTLLKLPPVIEKKLSPVDKEIANVMRSLEEEMEWKR